MDQIRQSIQMCGKLVFAQLSEILNHHMSAGLPPNLTGCDVSTDFGFQRSGHGDGVLYVGTGLPRRTDDQSRAQRRDKQPIGEFDGAGQRQANGQGSGAPPDDVGQCPLCPVPSDRSTVASAAGGSHPR